MIWNCPSVDRPIQCTFRNIGPPHITGSQFTLSTGIMPAGDSQQVSSSGWPMLCSALSERFTRLCLSNDPLYVVPLGYYGNDKLLDFYSDMLSEKRNWMLCECWPTSQHRGVTIWHHTEGCEHDGWGTITVSDTKETHNSFRVPENRTGVPTPTTPPASALLHY